MYQILFLTLVFSSTKSEMEGFIVGGQEVSIRHWPFITFIEALLPKGQTAACGGSLLSSRTVLTAAHCLDDMTEQRTLTVKYTIFMGHTSFMEAPISRTVKDYETHYDYDPASDDVCNDIGIIILTKPVTFIPNVKKVLLVKRKFDLKRHKHLLVAGWGRFDTKEQVRISAHLKHLKLTSISLKQCSEKHPYIKDITRVVCAAPSTEFAYSGDSGGPMVEINGRLQLGIVSFRNVETRITVFTSVPSYYNWINKTNFKLLKKYCNDYT